MIVLASGVVFALGVVSLHLIHRRIARDRPDLAAPVGRVLFEITPSTRLSRELTRGRLAHPLAGLYRAVWYVYLASGLVFAVSLMVSSFSALRA